MTTLAAPCLVWRTHASPGGGYVRTAVGADGSLLVNSFLADRGQHGGMVVPVDRMVIVPPHLAGAFVRGLMADVRRRERSARRGLVGRG